MKRLYLFILFLIIITSAFSQIHVKQDGKVFANMTDATNYVSGLSTSSNPYRIDIESDSLREAPFTVPSYCKVFAGNAELYTTDNNSPFISFENNCEWQGGIIIGATNDCAFYVDTANVVIRNVQIATAGKGICAVDTADLTIHELIFTPLVDTAIHVSGGSNFRGSSAFFQGKNTNTLFYATDSLSNITFLTVGANNIENAVYADNKSRIDVGNLRLTVVGNILRAKDSAQIIASGISAEGDTLDIYQETADAVIDASGFRFNEDKGSVLDWSNVYVSGDNVKVGDVSFSIFKELHVGTPREGRESVFGEGDSYTIGMLVYTYNGSTYTDVSTEAKSATLSTFAMPGTGVNNMIYVASGLYDYNDNDYLKYHGLKVSTEIAAILGTGTIEQQYYNGATWVTFDIMTTDADSPRDQHADSLFVFTQPTHIRFAPGMVNDNWTRTNPMGLDSTYYWTRYVVTSAITTAPVFQQFKLHSSRVEINDNGRVEYFGNARNIGDLLVHQRLTDDVLGASPGNATIDFADNISLTLVDNQFNDNTVDASGQIINIVKGLDTSGDIVISVLWQTTTSGSGNVELEIDFAQIVEGDTLDASIVTTNVSEIVSVNNQDDVLVRTFFTLDASSLIPGDILVFRLFRDATAGNGDDTYGGNIYIVGIRGTGLFWQ